MRRRTIFGLVLSIAVAGAAMFVYGSLARTRPPPAASPIAIAAEELARAYPPGRWRLAPRQELEYVVLFLSHILVRHRDAASAEPPFAAADWKVQPAPPSRSREEALARARSIAERARRAPAEFAALARAYSEDAVTRDLGGSLGGLSASLLVSHPQVLDALASVKPGEISEVLETPYGFHVMMRRPPPQEQRIAARRIVIGHDAAPWLEFQSRDGTVRRSRTEANAIAHRLREQLRTDPAAFTRLVREHSEHRDAALEGDMGQWSNREPSPLRRQLELLAGMQIGEISEPIETPIGVEILQRLAPDARPVYALAAIKLAFDPAASDGQPASAHNTGVRAQSILKMLEKRPDSFAAFQAQYCCQRIEGLSPGRGNPELLASLAGTPVGGIAPRVVQVDQQYVIAKRLPAASAPVPRFELPVPAAPDLEHLVRNAAGPGLSSYTRELAGKLKGALSLQSEQSAKLDALFGELAAGFATDPPLERVQRLHNAQGAIRQLLGEEKFQAYLALVNAEVVKTLMNP